MARSLAEGKLPIVKVDEAKSYGRTIHPEPDVRPDSMAYILYTSGSTGLPKGVMQRHRSVLHFIRNYTNNLRISADDRLTLLSSYGFDAAIMDIFGALLNGALLCPLDLKEEGIEGLVKWVGEQRISIYHSAPSVYRYFVGNLKSKHEVETVRLVVLGGEEVNGKDIESYKEWFSEESIFVNGYGPTESTVSLQKMVTKQAEIIGGRVPIGCPVEDTEALLLN